MSSTAVQGSSRQTEAPGKSGQKSGPKSDRKPGRVVYWDNLRGALMFLVVFGHFVQNAMHDNFALRNCFLWIYSFHMPLFVFVAGLMTSPQQDARRWRSSIERLIVPYLIFEVLYSFWEHWMLKTPKLVFSFATPFWPLWFLMSLFVWRAFLPYLNQVRGALWILVLISVGFCASGEVWGYFFSVSRTVFFFPFFYLGHLARGLDLQEKWSTRHQVVAGVALLALFVGLMTVEIPLRPQWFWGTVNTHQLGFKNPWAAFWRIPVYALSALLALMFMVAIPKTRIPLVAGWGLRSMPIYLFHFFLLFAALGQKWFELLPKSPLAKGGVIFGVSLLCTAVMGSKIFDRATALLHRPPVGWLWRTQPD